MGYGARDCEQVVRRPPHVPSPTPPPKQLSMRREPVEGLLDENPKFRALDTAIAKEGFKVILLLRLSPIFPFALSNYLYGVTSVDFFEYMMGTLIGFFPGTLAYVYGGTVSYVSCLLLVLLACIYSSGRIDGWYSHYFKRFKTPISGTLYAQPANN